MAQIMPVLLLTKISVFILFFFFQAEDGIRDTSVTGVQTCALPISHVLAPGRGHVRPRERGHHVRLDRRVSPTRGSDGRLRWRPVTYLARRLSGDVHERRPGLPDRDRKSVV